MTFYIHHIPLNGYVGQGGMGRKFSHRNDVYLLRLDFMVKWFIA